MTNLPFWEIGDDTLSAERLKHFANYLRTDIVRDIEKGEWNRKIAISALEWIADQLDSESAAPCVLRPVKKARNRPKGSGKDWFTIGEKVQELIDERLPNPSSVSQREFARVKNAAFRDVAKSHRPITVHTIRTCFDRYQQGIAENERISAEEWAASESEKKSVT